MKKFASYDEYEAWCETVENPERYHSYIDDGWNLMIDMTTNCKSYKTAIRRFRKTYAELANVLTEDEFYQFDGWFDAMESECDYGCFEEAIKVTGFDTPAEEREFIKTNGGYWFGVDEVSEGCWYMYLNISGIYLGRAPRETAEETTETAETVETIETEATTATETTMTTETTETTTTTTTTETKPETTTATDSPADTTEATDTHILNLPGCTKARMSLGARLAKPPDHSVKIGDFHEYVEIYDGPVMDIKLKSKMITVYRVGENGYFLHMHD